MQDRYAGDVGDFIKLGLLRAISFNRKLGVAWYRYPDESHNGDGRHTGYLDQPTRYEKLDRELYVHLKNVVETTRTINSLLPALEGAISANECLDVTKVPAGHRRNWRGAWFSRVLDQLVGCDLVFADPDNGIVDNNDRRKGSFKFGKQIPLAEAHALAQGRCAVIYHHNTRRSGGHDAEVDHWLNQFHCRTIAVRARAFSPRTFFVLNPDLEIEERVRFFCSKWQSLKVELQEPGK